MMSPEQSDIRKSLESIQSMLSSSDPVRSPMQATSLLKHRSSFEGSGGRRSTHAEEWSSGIGVSSQEGGLPLEGRGRTEEEEESLSLRRPSAIRQSPSSAFSTVSIKFGAGSNTLDMLSPLPFSKIGDALDGVGGGTGMERGSIVVAPTARSGRETSLLVSPISRHSSSSTQPSSGSSARRAMTTADANDLSLASGGSVPRYGPTGTPMAAVGSFSGATDRNSAPTREGSTNSAFLQTRYEGGGKDPTPYHYRSQPSFSPPDEGDSSSKRHSESSSRSGLDPPAKSPFSMATPNKAHHFRNTDGSGNSSKDEQQRQLKFANAEHVNELSMIDEDEISTTGQSLVSNVTGATLVRTPMSYKRPSTKNSAHALSLEVANDAPHATPGSSTVASTFTTRLGPNHARPSIVMRESLAKLASTTCRSLESIWDDVGVSPDERSAQLTDLVENIARLCESKVQEEEALRDQFQKEIADARTEWIEICTALQITEEDPLARMRRDPSAEIEGGGGVSLQWEYEAMMGRLESLRSVKECAMSDMLTSRARIYDAHAALCGCTVEEAAMLTEMRLYADVETNLTLERREAFRDGANQYEENVSTRVRAIVSLLMECQSLIRELDISTSHDITVGRNADDFKIMNSLQPIDENVANDDQGRTGRGKSNNYTITSLFESSTSIGIGTSSLDRLTSRIAELNGEKRRRRAKLGEMGQTISTLWTMLRVTPDEQRTFTTSIRGLGMDTIRKGEAEIARLEELKKAMIGQLVREQRSAIEELWIKTGSCDDERASFDAYYQINDDELLTSEVLIKHEDYAVALKSKLSKMQPILDLIAKREAIIEERIELELLQKDPERLKGRGATKQLMKEEKMNRRVTKELPKITHMLEETLQRWYVENKDEQQAMQNVDLGHFMYQGSPYLHTMQWQEEEWRTRKERCDEERNRKKQENRDASLSSFGHVTKHPGKKWNPVSETPTISVPTVTTTSTRPRSASNLRAAGSGGSHPSRSDIQRSTSNPRLGGHRGPLGDVSSTRNAPLKLPTQPKYGSMGTDRPKTAAGGGRVYRPPSAPRQRL